MNLFFALGLIVGAGLFGLWYGDRLGQDFRQKQYEEMLIAKGLLTKVNDKQMLWAKYAVGRNLEVIMSELNRLQAKCGEEVTGVSL